jgi:hypothetical protein
MAKTKSNFNFQLVFLGLLFSLVALNFYLLASTPREVLQAKILASSLSKGQSYLGKLRLWQIFVQHDDWKNADILAASLDPSDTQAYQSLYSPDGIKTQINTLQYKSDKSPDDYISLAKAYYRLKDVESAKNALTQAQTLDPIRDDIGQLLRSLN